MQYVAFRILAMIAPVVPPALAYWLCDLVGDATFRLLRRQRETVLRNLSVVTGKSPESLHAMARETFREGVKYYYDTFRAPALSDQEMETLVRFDGLERISAALEKGKGAIILTAHYGSPALVVQLIAMRGYKITTVVEPVKPQKLFDLMNGARGSRGIKLLPLGPNSFRDLSAALSRNEVVGVLADRDLQGNGISVKLFGEDTRLPAGTALLALRSGAPVLPAFGVRMADGRFRGTMTGPVELVRTGDLREDIRLNTQKMAEVLEDAIGEHPAQWIVFEPIWPETGTSAEAGR